ncbi:hypothetical protein J6590_068715 [Homalodisca vitripennis]|nr:hypothetical protein J6590_068715 [Homalodisca vitripennis]
MQCSLNKTTQYSLLSFILGLTCVCAFGSSGDENNSSKHKKTSECFKSTLLTGIFVDKSLLIHEILTREERVFQITRPRKWGKTFNLDMLRLFFGLEYDQNGNLLSDEERSNSVLFRGGEVSMNNSKILLKSLKISRYENAMSRFGKHPVISLSLKNVKGNSMMEIEERFKCTIFELFSGYPFLMTYLDNSSDILDEDEKQRLGNFIRGTFEGEYLFDCLEYLSMLLYEHFHSYVCLFIDDYDIPVLNAFLKFGDRSEEFQYLVEMFRRFYEHTFKENQYLFKGVITGTINFNLVPSGSSEFQYRYILYSTLLDRSFSKYYGFTHEDIVSLHCYSNITDIQQIRKWYGGFFLNGLEIYIPGSVVEYITHQKKYDYYLQIFSDENIVLFLEKAFLVHGMQEFLLLLAEGKEIIRNSFELSVSLRNIAADFNSIFVHAGYLNLITPERVTGKPIWRMKIPNLEVRGAFASGFRTWTQNEFNITSMECKSFIDLLVKKEIKQFAERFHELLVGVEKYNVKAEEHCYHTLMGSVAASLGLGHLVDSIKELGQNRGENVIIPLKDYGTVAINIEYIVCKPWQNIENIVNTCLEDLLHRPRTCSAKIRSHKHVGEILYVSLGFCGPKVVAKYKVIKV